MLCYADWHIRIDVAKDSDFFIIRVTPTDCTALIFSVSKSKHNPQDEGMIKLQNIDQLYTSQHAVTSHKI
jgi:hypothetical protein